MIKYLVNTTRNEIMWKETYAHAFASWKQIWTVFFRTIPEMKFHFISPVMKSNVNRISFTVGWSFISGRFYFEPHVNTLFIHLNVSIYILMIQKWSKIRARFTFWLKVNEPALKVIYIDTKLRHVIFMTTSTTLSYQLNISLICPIFLFLSVKTRCHLVFSLLLLLKIE